MALMATIIVFLLGIANFAMHKAMLESRHPMVAEARASLGWLTRSPLSYALEFAILVAALGFARIEAPLIALFYGGYTAINALGAWFLLRFDRH